MPRKTITPKYINQPRPGKKKGSIKTTDDEYYSVDPAQLQLFKKDVPITVDWYSNEFNGNTYFHIKDIIPNQNPNAAPAGGGTVAQDTGEVAAAIREQTEVLRGIVRLLKEWSQKTAAKNPAENEEGAEW